MLGYRVSKLCVHGRKRAVDLEVLRSGQENDSTLKQVQVLCRAVAHVGAAYVLHRFHTAFLFVWILYFFMTNLPPFLEDFFVDVWGS